MFRSFVLVSAFAATTAFACPAQNYQVGDVSLSSDGVVTRVIYVDQSTDSQKANAPKVSVPVVRDRIFLAPGDVIMLNTNPTMMDAMIQLEVRGKSQSRDAKGIFSTTYFVRQIFTPMMGGVSQKSIEKTEIVTVKGAYTGNGTYSRDCGGSVEKIDIETN